MIYIYHFNKHPSIEKYETIVDEITYQIGERSYRLPCELLGTEVEYPKGGQAIDTRIRVTVTCNRLVRIGGHKNHEF
jgi:hypothetical protein